MTETEVAFGGLLREGRKCGTLEEYLAFLDKVTELEKAGLSMTEIAETLTRRIENGNS